MKQIGKKLTLALLVLLSFVMMLTGVVTLHTNVSAADAPAVSHEGTESDWFSLDYNKELFSLKLSGNYRDYLNSDRSSLSRFVSAVTKAAQEVLIESILDSVTEDAGQGSNIHALAAIMPIDDPLGPHPSYDPSVWDDNARLKEFKDYVTKRLSDPAELEKYYQGEYDMVLEYAIGAYIEAKGTDGTLDEEQKQGVAEQLGDILNTAKGHAQQNAQDQVKKEYLEELGKTDESQLTPEEQQTLTGRVTEAKEQFDQMVTKGEADRKEQFGSFEDMVQKVEDNGGKPSITARDIFNALRSVYVDGLELFTTGEGSEGITNFKVSTLRHIIGLLPKPSEIANKSKEEMEKLISMDLKIGTTFGDISFEFSFGFFGDTQAIRHACSLLAEYLDFTVSGDNVSAEIRVPEVFTKVLLKLTKTTKISDTQKNAIFSLFGKTAGEILDKVETYSYEDLIEFFKGIDYESWMKNLLNAEFINSYFGNYLTRIFDRTLTEDDINRVVDAFQSRAAALAQKGWDVDDALAFLRERVPFFTKIESSVPEKAKQAAQKLLEIVNEIDWTKYDSVHIRETLAEGGFNDTIDSYIEKFNGVDLYSTFISYMEKLVDALPENVKDGTILGTYTGEGEFRHSGDYTFDFDRLFAKVENFLRNRGHEGIADYVSEFRTNVEGKTSYSVALDLHVTTTDIYKVSYYLGDETQAREGLLPAGAPLDVFANHEDLQGYEIVGWMRKSETFEAGMTELLKEMPKEDIELYPVTEFMLTDLVDKAEKSKVEATYDPETKYALSVDVKGVDFADYLYQWSYSETAKGTFEPKGTGKSLTVQEVADSGFYRVTVTDSKTGETVESETFEVVIKPIEIEFDGFEYTQNDTDYFPYETKTQLVFNNETYYLRAIVKTELPEGVDINDLVTFENASGKDVGEWDFKAVLKPDVTNYILKDESGVIGHWKIAPLEITLTYRLTDPEGKDIAYTYNHSEQSVQWVITATAGGERLENYTDFLDVKEDGSVSKATDAGSYTAKLQITVKEEIGSGNILLKVGDDTVPKVEAEETWTIAKAKISFRGAKLQYAAHAASHADADWEDYKDALPYLAGGYDVRLVLADDWVADGLKELAQGLLKGLSGTEAEVGSHTLTAKLEGTEAKNFELLGKTGETVTEYTETWQIAKATISAPEDVWAENNKTFTVEWVKDRNWIGAEENPVKFLGLEQAGYLYADYFTLAYHYYTDADRTQEAQTVTEVGHYFVTAVLTLKSEYEANYTVEGATTFQATFDIGKVTITFDASFAWQNNTVTYDGTPKAVTYAGTSVPPAVEGLVVINYYKGTEKLDGAPTNAGSYTVKLEPTDPDHYQLLNVTDGTLTIAKATVTVTVQPETLSQLTFRAYPEEEIKGLYTVTVKVGDNDLASDRYKISYVEGFTNVVNGKPTSGSFTAKFEIKIEANYVANYMFENESDTMTVQRVWTVAEEHVIPEVRFLDTYFEFTPSELTFQVGDQIDIKVKLVDNFADLTGVSPALFTVTPIYEGTQTAIGEYPLSVKVELKNAADKGNYILHYGTDTDEGSGALVIANPTWKWKIVAKPSTDKTVINLQWSLEQANFIYDGKEHEVKLVYTTDPENLEDQIEYSFAADSVNKATEPGSYTVKVTFRVKDATKYCFKDGSDTLDETIGWSIVAPVTPEIENYEEGHKFSFPFGSGQEPEVEVEFKSGTLPKTYQSSITEALLDDYLDDIQGQDAMKDQKYVGGKAYDIHFNDADGKEQSVSGKFHVKLLIPEDIRECDHIYVIHIADDNSIQIIDGAQRHDNYMEFDVDGFSVYAVVGFNDATANWLLLAGLALIALLLLITLIVLCVFTAKLKKPEEAAEEEPAAAEAVEEPVEEEAVEEVAEEPAEETAEEPAEEVPAETEEAAEEAPAEAEETAEEAPAEEEAAVEAPAAELPVIAAEPATMTIYDRSFTARLVQAENDAKGYYNELKNYILSYKYVRSRISWSYDTFNKGRHKICKLQFKGKSLYMYIALDPDTLDEKYHHKSVKDVAKYEDYPTKLKIRSARSLKYAKQFIDMIMGELELERDEAYEKQDFTLAYKTTDELIASGEIRKKEVSAPEFWNMDASDVIENSPALPDVELPEEKGKTAATKSEDDE